MDIVLNVQQPAHGQAAVAVPNLHLLEPAAPAALRAVRRAPRRPTQHRWRQQQLGPQPLSELAARKRWQRRHRQAVRTTAAAAAAAAAGCLNILW